MRIELVRIGNSRGIRIPRALIQQYGFGGAVELGIEENRLTIMAERVPRQGWTEAFRQAGEGAEDEPVLGELPANEFDIREWEW